MLELVVRDKFPNLRTTTAFEQYVDNHFKSDNDKKDLKKVYGALSDDIHRPKMPIQKLDVTMSDLNGHQYKVLKHIWDNFAKNDPDNPAGSFLNFK